MSRRLFGWDLPPGVSQRMIDEAYGEEEQEGMEPEDDPEGHWCESCKHFYEGENECPKHGKGPGR